MAQYYMQIFEEILTIAGPFNKLRKQGVVFKWMPKRQKAFEYLKQALDNDPLLIYYDEKLRSRCQQTLY